ncbi:hypothetical protein SOVF_204300, partial [Spinacia oleracea]
MFKATVFLSQGRLSLQTFRLIDGLLRRLRLWYLGS